jgi:hypothetical protein
MSVKETDFYNTATHPVPPHMLTLPVRASREGPEYRFCWRDFGFTEHPKAYVGLADSGDREARALLDRTRELFKELMRLDTQPFAKRNALNGDKIRDPATGRDVTEIRSQWIEDTATARMVNAGNVVLPIDHWLRYVDANWHEIVGRLQWFDPEPSTDPESPHNDRLIARKLHPGNPQRLSSLRFMLANGLPVDEMDKAWLRDHGMLKDEVDAEDVVMANEEGE